MTNEELQQLSQAVADKYGIEAYIVTGRTLDMRSGYIIHKLWLVDDWARLMPLAVEQGLDLMTSHKNIVGCTYYQNNMKQEQIKDHPTKQQAVRVAILRALLERK
jgi:hypothetical protein